MWTHLYPALRPLLFCQNAETAHDLTLAWLRRTQHTPLASVYRQPLVDDPIEVAGVTFRNRVGLAAGLDKNAWCIDAWAAMGFGAVEVGTVTPLAQPGNPKPRMFRLVAAQALINRLGFNNEGLQAFVQNVQTARCWGAPITQRPAIGLNIGKNASTTLEHARNDYLLGLQGVYPFADYITVNVSSPNTPNLRQLQHETALCELLESLLEAREQLAQRHGQGKPIFLKIAPDMEPAQADALAHVMHQLGCNSDGQPNHTLGLIVSNTTVARDAVQGLPHADQAGGLSGAPLRQASLGLLQRMRTALGPTFALIGVGGVLGGPDAVAKAQAGAHLVQLYTGLIYRGPALVQEVAQALQNAPRP